MLAAAAAAVDATATPGVLRTAAVLGIAVAAAAPGQAAQASL